MECVRHMVSICCPAWRQPSVSLCDCEWPDISVRLRKGGTKGYCWDPGEDKDTDTEAQALKRTMDG